MGSSLAQFVAIVEYSNHSQTQVMTWLFEEANSQWNSSYILKVCVVLLKFTVAVH